MHHDGDAEQEVGIQGGAFEKLIDMVAATRDLFCQPTYAALIGFQLCLNDLTDMDVAVVFHALPMLSFGLPSMTTKKA